jgi:hypothetical protein
MLDQHSGGSRYDAAMKFAPALLAALCFLPASRSQEHITFAPREGSKLAKQLDFDVEMRVTHLEFDGSQVDVARWDGVGLHTSSKFTDLYERIGHGRPLELLRTIGAVVGRWEFEGERHAIAGFDSIRGCEVRFAWDAERRSYSRKLESGQVEGLRVDNFVEDLDLRFILPVEPVQVGAQWTARGRPIAHALFGSTEMGLLASPRYSDLDVRVRDVFLQPFRELCDDQIEISCRYAGSTQAPRQCERVELRVKNQYDFDATVAANEFMRSWSMPTPIEDRFSSFLVRYKGDGEGHVDWNVAEARFTALDLDTKFELEISATWMSMPILLYGNGTAEWRYRAETAP